MKSNRYGKISLWKFIFCLLIIALHTGENYENTNWTFKAGSIGVEFFFLVSGYYFAKKCLNHKQEKPLGEETFDFLKDKIKRFSPYIIILLLIAIPFCYFEYHYTITDYTRSLYKLLIIPNYVTSGYAIYGINWYIMALIISETILFPLVTKYKKNFIYIVSPIISILILNYLIYKTGYLVNPGSLTPFGYKGLVRGFMEINIGMYLYILSLKFNEIKFTKLSKILLMIIEVLGYASIFYIVNLKKAHPKFDVLMLIILSMSLLITMNKNLYLTNIFNSKVIFYLEKLSLPMYTNQWLTICMVKALLDHLNLQVSYPIMFTLSLLSLLFLGIVSVELVRLYNKKKDKIKRIFIAD